MKTIILLVTLVVGLWIHALYADTSTEATSTPFEKYGLLMCSQPGYECKAVKPGQTWFELFPDKMQREVVMRLNRTNVALKYRQWIVIPKNLKHLNYLNLAPFPETIAPNHRKLLLVDLKKFAFAAYDKDGKLVFWGPATGGKTWCKDLDRTCQSAAGTFTIYRIQGDDCTSSKYPLQTEGGAPMPWCMHYFKGFAIHGSTLAGFENRSRGCIRIFDSDAKWLNQHFVQKGTEVIVQR